MERFLPSEVQSTPSDVKKVPRLPSVPASLRAAMIALPLFLSCNKEDGAHDSDGDGLTDAAEVMLGTDPNKADSDDDGCTDLEEYKNKTNPQDPNDCYGSDETAETDVDTDADTDSDTHNYSD